MEKTMMFDNKEEERMEQQNQTELEGSDREPSFDNNSIETLQLVEVEEEEAEEEAEYAGGCFEGPEKTLEVVFRNNVGHPEGLRSFTREQLDNLCTLAKCSILSSISNNYMDAYVLSESSMFVYKYRYIMKTCGTTTLLRCLKTLLLYADEIGMELTWVGYSRKNLKFPQAQLWPHLNFAEEINYIAEHGNLQDRLRGAGHILGPVTGDHWFVYVADLFPVPEDVLSSNRQKALRASSESPPATLEGSVGLAAKTVTWPNEGPALYANDNGFTTTPSYERTINMMMFDMAADVAEIFFKRNTRSGREMTVKAGINMLCPGATIDETAFTPCGYSMNAILHDAYFTIHVTPEPQCSYVSFETNACLRSYDALVRNVLSVFRPKRLLLTMFGDDAAFTALPELPTDSRKIVVAGIGSYVRTSQSGSKVDAELGCQMANFSLDSSAPPSARLPQTCFASPRLS